MVLIIQHKKGAGYVIDGFVKQYILYVLYSNLFFLFLLGYIKYVMKQIKPLRELEEYTDNPFLNGSQDINTINLMTCISKPSQKIILYMSNKGGLIGNKFVFEMEDFLNFSNYKTKSGVFRALAELCQNSVIAKTKVQFVYWINKRAFPIEMKNI